MAQDKPLVHISDDYKITYCGKPPTLVDVWDGFKKTCKECLQVQADKNIYSQQNDKWDF